MRIIQTVNWKSLLLALFVVSGIFCLPLRLPACLCAPLPAPEDAVKTADSVFLGLVEKFEATGTPLVVRSQKMLEDYGLTTTSGRDRTRIATFRVLKLWKGPKQSAISITTGAGGGDCGYEFIVGEVYLVYAYGGEVHLCSRTKRAWRTSDWEEDFKTLGPGTVIANE